MSGLPGDLPAIEGSGMGAMSLPSGMTRRALSYDDALEAPMATPPYGININNLWRRPVIPERRFTHLAEEDESGESGGLTSAASEAAPSRSPGVVKNKASSVIINSLITKQTQDSMHRFEEKVGLTDTSYTPHKGLTAEETRYHHRMPESFHKLQMQNLEVKEVKEEKQSSTQSSPSNTPHSSPKHKRRGWFSSTGSEMGSSSSTSMDMGGEAAGGGGGGAAGGGAAGGGGGGGIMERWSAFGQRPVVQKSTSDLGLDSNPNPAGFALQSYQGAQKPTPMEVMKAQATRLADDPAAQKVAPPVMEIPAVEGRRQGARPHKLKPRDMNILTPSGF